MRQNYFEPGTNRWVKPTFLIWGGQALSLVGSQLVQFAIVWWVTQTTGSATLLATASLIALLPQIVLGPFVGALIDRWNRRLIMIVADTVSALALVVMAYLFWRNLVSETVIWPIFVVMFFRSLANGFHTPAMQASVSLMVPKEHLSRIQGLNQVMLGFMAILGAPMGALMVALLDMHEIILVDIVTAVIAVVPLLFIRLPQPARPAGTELVNAGPTVWQDFQSGLRYVFSWRGMVLLMLMAAFINLLLTPASSLLPILITKVFNRGALQLAWMQSAFGIGTIVGGIILGVWGGFRRRIVTSLLGLILLGLSMIFMGMTPIGMLSLAIGMAFVVGFTGPIVDGPLFAVMQSTVEPGMQGRVFTLINSITGVMTPIGLLIAGPIADTFGVRTWYIAGGIVTALLGLVSFAIPAILRIEDGHAPRLAEKEEPVLTAGN